MREFLKGLFEDDTELIDTIMAEYGKHITEAKEEIVGLKDQIQNYEDTIADYENQILEDKQSLESFQDLTNENNNLKAQLQMSDSNVKKEFSKFVTSEVMSQVNDDTDFATALESYKKENPQYFGETVVKKVQSSPTLSSGGAKETTTNDVMNDILRSAVNNN